MQALNYTAGRLFALFASQQNWQDRYKQLIKLASLLPNFSINETNSPHFDHYRIEGCENTVWLKVERQPDNTFLFAADSDGRIVKGLLSVLIIVIQGKTAEQILAMDFDALFKRLKLSSELSESRLIGLQKITRYLIAQVTIQTKPQTTND